MTNAQVNANCWKGFQVTNAKDPQVGETTDAIVWSWRPNKLGKYARIKIQEKHYHKAKSCLELLDAHALDRCELDDACNEE